MSKRSDSMDDEERQQQRRTPSLVRQDSTSSFSGRVHRRRRHADEAETSRLVSRDLSFHQSRNKIRVANQYGRHHKIHRWWMSHWSRLFAEDWFHAFLRWPTVVSLLLLIALWTGMILIFALIYRAVDEEDPNTNCGLGEEGVPIKYGAAFGFSLETCTTVGYGLPGSTNAFFENCPALQFVIYLQMLWSMLFNAFLLAFFFARVARSETRGIQVLFSNKALIVQKDNRWLFQVRVYDADAPHPVVEAHVRLYAAKQHANYYEELRVMRLLHPNDDLGGVLFTSFPTTISHEIDAFSPLTPKKPNHVLIRGGGLTLREVDSQTGNRDGYECPICGETYGSFQRLERHLKYQKMVEEKDEYPVEGSHQEVELEKPGVVSLEEIRQQLQDMEILCLVEGIDPLMSGTFQALQSYTIDDVHFGGTFAPCLVHSSKNKLMVDLDCFHNIIEEEESNGDNNAIVEEECIKKES